MFENIEHNTLLVGGSTWRLEVNDVVYSGSSRILEDITLEINDKGSFQLKSVETLGVSIESSIYVCALYTAVSFTRETIHIGASKIQITTKQKELPLPSKKALALYKLKGITNAPSFMFRSNKEDYIQSFFDSPDHLLYIESEYVRSYSI